MGPHVEASESAAPALLVLSTESILVRITLCGLDTPSDGMTANLTRATWGARCGKSARRVLRGGTGTSDLVARLVPTHRHRIGIAHQVASTGIRDHPLQHGQQQASSRGDEGCDGREIPRSRRFQRAGSLGSLLLPREN